MSVPADIVVDGGEDYDDDAPPPTPATSEDNTRDSTERDGSEEGEVKAPAVQHGGNNKESIAQQKPLVKGPKDEDEEERKKRRMIAGFCCCLTLLIIFLIILILFFSPDTGGAARAFEGTLSPTGITTDAPTRLTVAPTPSFAATETPTIASDVVISRLPCLEIRVEENVTAGNFGENNYKNYTLGDRQICGDTYGGEDPDRPNRNEWSVRYGRRNCPLLDYEGHVELCDFVGARLCTVDEYFGDVATGTGCGGDRVFVWTSTQCVKNGVEGRIMFDLGLRDSRKPFTECITDLSVPSVLRCCGDNY